MSYKQKILFLNFLSIKIKQGISKYLHLVYLIINIYFIK